MEQGREEKVRKRKEAKRKRKEDESGNVNIMCSTIAEVEEGKTHL